MSTAYEQRGAETLGRSGASTQGGATSDLKGSLRGMSYAQQQAALRPGPMAPMVQLKEAKPDTSGALLEGPSNDQRRKLLKDNAGAINSIEDLLDYEAFDWNVSAKEAKKAANMLEKAKSDAARMVMIQELNRRKPAFLERMMDNLDAAALRSYPKTVLTWRGLGWDAGRIRKMVQRESPAQLGVGRTDAVALVMRKLDLSAVSEIARLQGKPLQNFQAWLDVCPGSVGKPLRMRFIAVKQEAEEARAEKQKAEAELAADKKQLAEASGKAFKEDAAFRKTVESVEDLLTTHALDWAITDKEARKAFSILASIDNTERVRMVVFRLDAGGFMDKLIDQLPKADRWKDKKTFLRILSARTPDRNVAFAEELLSYGVFDWAITDEEAKLAFHLVKLMPKHVRQKFREGDGGKWWERMEDQLSVEDASDRDANFYGNTEQSQKLKLSFAEDAAKLPQGQLRMQIEMLFRMGEVDFVEQSLMAAGLDKSGDHQWIYATYGLKTSATPRNDAVFSGWMDNKLVPMEEGGGLAGIGQLLKAAGWAIDAAVCDDQTQTSTELDLQDIFALGGGNIGGMQMADRGADKDANKLKLTGSLGAGFVRFELPTFALSSVNQLSDGVQTQTGPVTLKGVFVEAKWPTDKDPSARLVVRVSGVDVKDIWQVSETDMIGVGHLQLGDFELRAARPNGPKPDGIADGVGRLMTELQDTFMLAVGAIQVDEPTPAAVAESLGGSLMGGMEAQISLGSLSVSDYATSGGDYAGSVQVKDASISISHNLRTDQLRAEIAAMEGQPGTEEKVAALKAQLSGLAGAEARYRELVAKYDAPDSTLEPYERVELQGLRDQLTVINTDVAVGSVALGNIDMAGQKVASVEMQGLKGSMTTQRPGAGGKAGTGVGHQMTATFGADSINVQGLEQLGGNRLEAYEARVAALKAKLDAGTAKEQEALQYDALSAEVREIHRKITKRDGLKLADNLDADGQAQLAQLNAELGPWETRAASTKVDSMELKGLAGSFDAQTGELQTTISQSTIRGIEQEGMKVAEAKATDVSLGIGLNNTMAGAQDSMASGKGFMDQVTKLDMAAGELGLSGVEMRSARPSKAKSEELEAVQLKAKLTPELLTDADRERLAALPGEISTARRNEARLDELRALQKADPAAFTAEMGAELKALEQYDATFKRVGSVQAKNAKLGLDAAAGTIEFGVDGAGGDGLSVTGVEMGRSVGGEDVTDMSVDKVSADELSGKVSARQGGGSLTDLMKVTDGKQDFGASLKGKGLAVEGYQAGKEGEAGYQKLDKATIADLGVDYDSGQYIQRDAQGNPVMGPDGRPVIRRGKLDMSMAGAEMTGFEQISASRIDAVLGEIAALEQEAKDQGELSAKDRARLAELRGEKAEYDKLKGQLKTAKSKSAKRRVERKLKDWEKLSTMSLERAFAKDADIELGNVGHAMSADFDPMGGPLDASVRSSEMGLEGYEADGTKLKSATMKNLDVHGTDVLNEDQRQIAIKADEIKARGYSGGGAWAHRATVKGLDANLSGKNLSAKVRHVGLAGAGSGGSSAGYVGISGARIGISNLGEKNQSMAGSFGALSVSKGKSKSKGQVATVAKLKGKRGSFSMGPGGKVSASLKSFSGSDANVVQTDDKGQKSEFGIADFSGTGASYSANNKGMTVGLDTFEAKTVTASGAATGNRQVEIGKVTVNGVSATMGNDGEYDVSVDSVGIDNVISMDEQGRVSTVEKVALAEIAAKGNSNTSVVDSASVGQVEVKNAKIDEAAGKVDLDLATVSKIEVKNVDYSDPKNLRGTVDVGHAAVEGLDATLYDEHSPATSRYRLASGEVVGLNAQAHGGGEYSGGVKRAAFEGLKVDQDVVDQCGDDVPIIGTTHLNVDGGHMQNLEFMANTNAGDFGANMEAMSLNGIGYEDRGAFGELNSRASVDSVDALGLVASGNYKSGDYSAGFKDARLQGVDYVAGQEGQAGYMRARADYANLGNGRDTSYVGMGADGTLNADIHGVDVGAATGPDGKVLPSFERVVANEDGTTTTDKAFMRGPDGKASNVSADRLKVTNLDPSDLSKVGGSAQAFGVDTGDLVYVTDGMAVHSNGAKAEALFMAGAGDGKVQAGYKGLEAENLQVFGDVDKDKPKPYLEQLLRVKGLKSEGGYAVLEGFAEGQDFGVVHARLDGLTTDTVQVKYKYKQEAKTWQQAVADYKKQKEIYDNTPFDPAKDRIVIDGLGNADGSINVGYEYFEDDGSFWNTVGGVFIGHEVEASTGLKDGQVDLRQSGYDVDGLVTHGLINSNPVTAGLYHGQALWRGPAGVSGLFGGAVGPGLDGLVEGPKRPSAPEAPDPLTFNSKSDLSLLDDVRVDADLTDLGGGEIQVGRQFQGDMKRGGSLHIHGDHVGEHASVKARNIAFEDVKAMDGELSAGSAGVQTVDVEVYNASSGEPLMMATMKGIKVEDVRYGKVPAKDVKGYDSNYDELTQRPPKQ